MNLHFSFLCFPSPAQLLCFHRNCYFFASIPSSNFVENHHLWHKLKKGEVTHPDRHYCRWISLKNVYWMPLTVSLSKQWESKRLSFCYRIQRKGNVLWKKCTSYGQLLHSTQSVDSTLPAFCVVSFGFLFHNIQNHPSFSCKLPLRSLYLKRAIRRAAH